MSFHVAGNSRLRQAKLPRKRTHAGSPADVTLVNLNLMLVNAGWYYDDENYIPLGLLYIAGHLEQQGFNVELVDYQLWAECRRFDREAFVEALGPLPPVVGLSCMSNLLPFAILVAEEIKRCHPQCTVVLGGVGPSPVAAGITQAFPWVDIVVEGEGELIMADILRGKRDRLPARRQVQDLDTLPLPAYSLLDLPLYIDSRSMVTSRGCPWKCTFCTEPDNFGSLRYRSVESIIAEIELLHGLGEHGAFLFQDDILPLNRKRFGRMLEAFRALSFPIEWKCFSRVDLMDEELMAEMVASGCVQIRYGIESGSNETLATIRKGFTIEKAFEVTRQSVKHFPSVHASFIWGYPFETVAAFEETISWVERFDDAGATVLLFEYAPLPGSALYRAHRQGLKFSRSDYSIFVVTGHEVLNGDGSYSVRPAWEAMYRLIEGHPEIFSGFYHYESAELLKMKQRLERYHDARRTPARNDHDR